VSDAGLTHLNALKNLKRLLLQGTKLSSMLPLKDMPLDEIRLTPRNITNQGLAILRNMKSLKSIGTELNQVWPAAEFWARYDKGEFTNHLTGPSHERTRPPHRSPEPDRSGRASCVS
jgi:hypothetical protein